MPLYAPDQSMRVTLSDGAGGEAGGSLPAGSATSANSAPVVIASDQAPISTTTQTRIASVTVTRPANTTAYAAGQAVGTAGSCLFTFTNGNPMQTPGGRGFIVSARLSKSTNVTTNASFRLWLHNTATFTAPAADQAAIAFNVSDRGKRLPFITFATMTSGGACAESIGTLSSLGIPYDMAGSEIDLVGILEATAAYTPGSSEVFFIELGIRAEL